MNTQSNATKRKINKLYWIENKPITRTMKPNPVGLTDDSDANAKWLLIMGMHETLIIHKWLIMRYY